MTSEPGAARVSAWGPALASRVIGGRGRVEGGACVACPGSVDGKEVPKFKPNGLYLGKIKGIR